MSKESFKKNVEQLPRSFREEKANVLVASWHVIHELMTKCFYCGINSVPLSMDHMIPTSRGGKHVINNIVPACKSCNNSDVG